MLQIEIFCSKLNMYNFLWGDNLNTVKRIFALLAVGLLLLSFCGAAFADNRNTTVYVTATGTKYHRKSCSYLSNSCYSRTLEEAVQSGYTACSRCKPPALDYSSTSKPSYRATPKTSYFPVSTPEPERIYVYEGYSGEVLAAVGAYSAGLGSFLTYLIMKIRH